MDSTRDSKEFRRTLAVTALLLAALGLYRAMRVRARARAKADRLIAAFDAAGVKPPSRRRIARLFGDGGAFRPDPGPVLVRAGIPAPLADQFVEIYCPDQAGTGLNG